jgi:hypothetical protein
MIQDEVYEFTMIHHEATMAPEPAYIIVQYETDIDQVLGIKENTVVSYGTINN